MIARNQRRAERAHDPRDIGANDFCVRDLFERAQNGWIIKRSALDHDMLPELLCICELDHLKQRILNDRIRKPRRNIRDGSAFLLRLFDV